MSHPEDKRDEDGNPRRRCLHISICAGVAGQRVARSCSNVAAGVATGVAGSQSQLWVCDQHKYHYYAFVPKKQFWDAFHHKITVEMLKNG